MADVEERDALKREEEQQLDTAPEEDIGDEV
jgi:hypothetical protein